MAQRVSICKIVIVSARAPIPMPRAPKAMPTGTKPPATAKKAMHITNNVSLNMSG